MGQGKGGTGKEEGEGTGKEGAWHVHLTKAHRSPVLAEGGIRWISWIWPKVGAGSGRESGG